MGASGASVRNAISSAASACASSTRDDAQAKSKVFLICSASSCPRETREGATNMISRIPLPARVFAVVLATITAAAVALPARACNADGEQAIFSCEAAHGRKFIELCAPAPLNAQDGYLRYRFGAQDQDGNEARVELAYPDDLDGSLARFYAAEYTYKGVYT